jgi:glycosyltransferase involved in cell wall biosynthesis
VTGFLVPLGDEVLLAAKLRELIEDPTLRSTMGSAARAHYESRFTFDRLVKETLALYHSVLSEADTGVV